MSNVIKKVFNTDKEATDAGKNLEGNASNLSSKGEQGTSSLSRGESAATKTGDQKEGVIGEARDKLQGMFGSHSHNNTASTVGRDATSTSQTGTGAGVGSTYGSGSATGTGYGSGAATGAATGAGIGSHSTSAGNTSTGAAASHALHNQGASTGLTSGSSTEKTGLTSGVTGSHANDVSTGLQPSDSTYGNRSSNLTQSSSVNSGVNVAAGNVDQDVQHLAPVTRETLHRQEIEELHREREHHIHQHHIQHHVQPVLDTVHLAEQLHSRVVPATTIREVHANTDKDAALLRSVAGTPKDTFSQAPIERSVIDKGETVREIVHHHIHNIVQPIIEKDIYEYHRIRTTVPTTQITHEAPIVHESTAHQPIRKEDFVKGGGVLTSETRTVEDAGLLNLGNNQRSVEGETYTGGSGWTQ
ncbi:hypothetical protein MPSI1_001142 [Malassezia psittaci]|uniref:Uncharacterized protein n=1 Tax=Malassezia psittaci TaxID=1821823 RepID=A0AAF0F8C8_9BASI|nr:hypothetical protein MPSI1_001142 [Malassezia psittaci]